MDEAFVDDARETVHVNVAAAEYYPNFFGGEVLTLTGHDCCDSHGARTFDDGLFAFEHQQHRARYLVVVHRYNVVHVALEDGKAKLSNFSYSDAIGDGGGAFHFHWGPGFF